MGLDTRSAIPHPRRSQIAPMERRIANYLSSVGGLQGDWKLDGQVALGSRPSGSVT